MEQLRDALALVILQVLVVGRFQRYMRPLQFDKDQRNTVHEAEQIATAFVHLATDPHLLGKEEVVILRVRPIDNRELNRLRVALVVVDLHLYPIAQQLIKRLIGVYRQSFGAVFGQLLDRLIVGRGRKPWIDTLQRLAETPDENDFGCRHPSLGAFSAEGFLVKVGRLPAEGNEAVNRGQFDQGKFAVAGRDFTDAEIGHSHLQFKWRQS